MSNRLIVVAILFAANASHADGAAIAGFLTSAEGDFTGKGTLATIKDGEKSSYEYDIELKIDASETTENAFTFESSINGDDGSIHGAHDSMLIQGDNLTYVNNAVASFPTRLITISETELKYAITFVSNLNGQVYEQIVDYTLSGDTLSASITTGTNGDIVSDDEFSASRY